MSSTKHSSKRSKKEKKNYTQLQTHGIEYTVKPELLDDGGLLRITCTCIDHNFKTIFQRDLTFDDLKEITNHYDTFDDFETVFNDIQTRIMNQEQVKLTNLSDNIDFVIVFSPQDSVSITLKKIFAGPFVEKKKKSNSKIKTKIETYVKTIEQLKEELGNKLSSTMFDSESVAELQNEKSQYEKKLKDFEKQLKEKNGIIADLNKEVQEYKKQNQSLNNKLRKKDGELEEKDQVINDLNEEISELKELLEKIKIEDKNRGNEYEYSKTQIEEMRKEIIDNNKKLKSENNNNKNNNNNLNELNKLRTDNDKLLDQLEKLKNQNKKLLEELESLKTENETNQQTINKYIKVEQEFKNQSIEVPKKITKKGYVPFLAREDVINISDIFINTKEVSLIENFIGIGDLKFALIYKASRDGDKAEIFHHRVSGSVDTLILVKTTEDRKFGGFTKETWDGVNIFKKDDEAFIFSLNDMKCYECNQEDAIWCYPHYGPIFGGYQIDIFDNFMHNDSNKTALKGVGFNTTKDFELNDGVEYFVVSELEVYHVEKI